VLTAKLLAALAGLTITNALVWAVSFLSFALFSAGSEYDKGVLLLLLASVVIFQLFFLCVGLAISLLVRRVRSVTPYSLGLGFGGYVLSAFSGIFADVKLEYLTPFKHLDPTYIVRNSGYDTPLVLLNAAITVMALGLSYWLYVRRDIPMAS
jgi:ABC-2 type transport system permease protein